VNAGVSEEPILTLLVRLRAGDDGAFPELCEQLDHLLGKDFEAPAVLTPEERRLMELATTLRDGQTLQRSQIDRLAGDLGEETLAASLASLARRSGSDPPEIRRWGHLEILGKIGAGSFGEVYRARDPWLDRIVALKLIRASGSPYALTEGRLLARVRHPNVATVHGTAYHDGRFGLWMEFLEGTTLAEQIGARGPFDPREAAEIGVDLCRALAAVHAQGIIHRDIKAQNVIRETGGRIVLADFGIGVDLRDESSRELPLSGTPLYMAPEALATRTASTLSDIYSLGVLLFHLLTGDFPARGRTIDEVRRAQEEGNVRRLGDIRPELPEDLVRIVEDALARNPAARTASAGDLERALLGFLERLESPPPARRWRAGLAALLGAGAVVAGILTLREPAPPLPPDSPALQLFNQSLYLHSESKIELAIQALETAVRLDPNFAAAYSRLSIYRNGIGDYEGSFEAARRAFALRDRVGERERLQISADYHLSCLQYEEALKEFQQAALLDPEDGGLQRQIAQLHYSLGEAGAGLEAARRARDLPPPSLVNHGTVVMLLSHARQPEAALLELAAARRKFGADPYLFWPEGIARLYQGDLPAAEAAFRALAEAGPTYASHGRILLAQVLLMEGRVEEANAQLESGVGLDQRKGFARNGGVRNLLLAKIYGLQGDREEALRYLGQLDGLPDLPLYLKIFRNAALLAVELGDLDRARRWSSHIDAIRDRYPSDLSRGFAAHVRGEIAHAERNFEQARAQLEQARMSWDDPGTLHSLARLWIERGRCDKALPLLDVIFTSEAGRGLGDFFTVWVDTQTAQRDRERCRAAGAKPKETRKETYD
jgi:serine/threonine protein kinase